MKYLPAFLLIGSLLSPAWSQEADTTPEEFTGFEEFIEKIGHLKPWVRENLEAKLGIKFIEQASSTEMYRSYTEYDPPPLARNMPIQYISLDVLKANNKTHYLAAEIDGDLVCLSRFDMRALYPEGVFDITSDHPGGGLAYHDGRAWGIVSFHFAVTQKKGECVTRVSFTEDRQFKEYDEDILKQIRGQK